MKNLSLRIKLITFFIIVGIVPFAVVGAVSLTKAEKALSDQAYNQLVAMRDVKKAQVEKFFAERQGDMGVLTQTVTTLRKNAFEKLEAIQEIKKSRLIDYFETMKTSLRVVKNDPFVQYALMDINQVFKAGENRVDTSDWITAAENVDARMKGIVKDNGWGDLYLISVEGDIIYTVNKQTDLGQSIPQSNLKDQGIGEVFGMAQAMDKDEIVLADMTPYAPYGGKPAGFMMSRLIDEAGIFQGFVAFLLPIDKINEMMTLRHGMGYSGESYLVGPDKLMRSDSFLNPEKYSVAASFQQGNQVDTEAVRQALAGVEDRKVILDYNGNPVLSCWDSVDLGNGVRWAMMSEMDVAEAFCPVNYDGKEYFAEYVNLYGYYDLFLMNPDGYCFYTVAKESDFRTNLVNGKFAESNLGELVRNVLKTKAFAFADFRPYAPGNGEPAAFIAQPVIHEGKTELVVALQLSLDAINSVMMQRDGMGETGETYLVGVDKLMRSDSYLDPENHTVKAAFANPEKGSVNTEATKGALAGVTGEKIITDYNGNPVLSAFTPLSVGDTTWALIAEIDEAEAFVAINVLEKIMIVVGVLGLAGIIAIALLVTRSIANPINRTIEGLSEGAEQVASASEQVAASSQSLAEGSSEQAAGIEETSSSLEEISSMTKQNAENAGQANSLMDEAGEVVGRANSAMGDLSHSIGEISEASEETFKIIKTIDEIAFQTNLLALNAAVEAARAGEAGAGFAVVADEVRNLAIRAADAAKNTAQLIEGTVKKVNDGTQLVEKANQAFSEVADSASRVKALVAEIAAASNEQSQGIEQVNYAVTDMDKVTQQNASSAEESASAAEEMAAQAEQMKTFVDSLSVIIKGGGNGRKNQNGMPKSLELEMLDRPSNGNGKKRLLSMMDKELKELSPDRVIPMDEDDLRDF